MKLISASLAWVSWSIPPTVTSSRSVQLVIASVVALGEGGAQPLVVGPVAAFQASRHRTRVSSPASLRNTPPRVSCSSRCWEEQLDPWPPFVIDRSGAVDLALS